MRIIAIRGENLASLAGHFALELEKEPLRGAGILAINGPTGAGKSTILDAMCLALFGTAPKLESAQKSPGALDGTDIEIKTNDPRTILRRGTGHGFAEVDFVGADGGRWRARWEVQRARKRPDGRLQNIERSLENLDTGKRQTGGRTEVEPAVERVLGLTFDQFHRAVLLAQGRTAAFLQAKGSDRAALLEKMTRTEIYGELSAAAHRKAVEAKQQEQDLRSKLEFLKVLPVEVRSRLGADLEEAKWASAEAEKALTAADISMKWYETLHHLEEGFLSSSSLRAAAEEKFEEAASLREELAAVEAARPLARFLADVDREEKSRDDTASKAKAAEENSRMKRAAAEAAATEAEQREAARKDAKTCRTNAEPGIVSARELDVRIQDSGENLADLERRAEEAKKAQAAAAKELQENEDEQRELETAVLRTNAWLEEHCDLRRLKDDSTFWRSVLAEVPRLQKNMKADALAHSTARARTVMAEEQAKNAAEDEQRLSVATAKAEEIAAGAQAALSRIDLKGLTNTQRNADEKRKACFAERATLDTLLLLRQNERSFEQEQRKREEAAEDADRKATEATATGFEARKTAEDLERNLKTLEEALVAADRARSFEEARADLTHGDPCPLCGSIEHPWSAGAPPFPSALAVEIDAIRKNLQAAREKGTAAETRKALLASSAASNRQEAAGISRELETVRGEIESRGNELQDLGCAVPTLAQDLAARISVAATEIRALDAEVESLRERQDDAEAQGKAAAHLRRAFEDSRETRELARQELRTVQKAVLEARSVQEIAAMKAAAGKRAWDGTLSQLSVVGPAFGPGWETRLETDPHGLFAFAEEQEREWTRASELKSRLTVEIATLSATIHELRKGVGEKAAAFQQAERVQKEAAEGHSDLVRKRQGIIGGRAVESVEKELNDAVRSAETAASEAQGRHARATSDLTAAEVQFEAAETVANETGKRAGDARTFLESTLSERRLTEPEVRHHLTRDEAWVEDRRLQLDDLDRARSSAKAIESTKRNEHQVHLETTRPGRDEETCRVLRETVAENSRGAQVKVGAIGEQISADERNRVSANALTEQIRNESPNWVLSKKIDDAIGSADGSAFRKFAQALTLEALVIEANHHLAQLARRYHLERIDAGDGLELRVLDREMADEARPVSSLSGGETFLVSLALALGLSSLSCRDARIDTLFIDEGFGSLDHESFDQAISTLAVLHATGRQVAVITHVVEVQDKVGALVMVEKTGGGASRLSIRQRQ